jgi:uncharacterized membrane protein
MSTKPKWGEGSFVSGDLGHYNIDLYSYRYLLFFICLIIVLVIIVIISLTYKKDDEKQNNINPV